MSITIKQEAIHVKENGVYNPVDVFLAGDIKTSVAEWLGDHPEASTTVQDKSLTADKFAAGALGYVTPEMFGAAGDGETDDTQAVKDMFAFALANHLNAFGANKYLVTDTITVTDTVNDMGKIVSFAGILIASFSDKPVIVFDGCHGWRINVNVRSSGSYNYYGGYDFTQAEEEYHYGALPYVGVTLRNCNRCEFSGYIINCNVGLRVEGYSGGSVYNFVHGVSIWNCAYGIELYANTSGWVNNNRFDACTTSCWSGIANRDKAVAVHIFASGDYPNNCNIFEGDYMSAAGQPAVLLEQGMYNVFFFRNEGSNTVIVDKGVFNRFISNYNSSSFTADASNVASNAVDDVLSTFNHILSVNANELDVVAWRSQASSYYAFSSDKLKYGSVVNGEFRPTYYAWLNPEFEEGYAPSGLGAFIEFGEYRTIAVKVSRLDSADIRQRFILFDDNKQLITNPGSYFEGAGLGGSPYESGGTLISGGNINKAFDIFTFKPGVRYIFVTATQRWSEMDIWVKEGSVNRRVTRAAKYDYDYSLQYPYFPINNELIKTSHPFAGKRLYSTVDGAMYVCTAVTDGVETWKKVAV